MSSNVRLRLERREPAASGTTLPRLAAVESDLSDLQTQVGITGSTVPTSIEYRLADVQAVAATASDDLLVHETDGNPHDQYVQHTLHASAHAVLGPDAPLVNRLSTSYQIPYDDIISRPPRLWPVDAIPHQVFCVHGGYAWGHLGTDNRTLIAVDTTTRAVTAGHQFPSGESIVFVFAARNAVLVVTTVGATSKSNLYRAASVNGVSLVHQIGTDGATHHPYISILDRGLDVGTLGGADALLFGTYNVGETYGVAAGSTGDMNYLARSLDDGRTWTKINTWNTGTRTIHHIHAVRYDAYRDCWWICTGDDQDKSMICRWDGTTEWPGNVTPAALAAYSGFTVGSGTSRWRVVDLLITDEWIESYTDTVSTIYGGIWRMRPDLSDSHRIDHLIYGKQHDGWSSLLCADGTHLWCDDCRDDTATNVQRHIGIYGSASGNRYYDVGRIALNGTGAVVILKGFFQDQNELIWLSCQQVAGKGPYETTILRLGGRFMEDRPDNIAPAFFVDFLSGSDVNSGKTAASAWKTVRNALAGNVVTHGARVMLTAGESIENGVATIDYASNTVPAADTDRAVQISGQSRGTTTITLSGATEGWRDSNSSKTWKIELSDLTFRQSDAAKVCLWDQATISGTRGHWIVRDATIGDTSTGTSYGFYARTCKIDLIRARVANIASATKYCLYLSNNAELSAESSIIEGGRNGQFSSAAITMKQCTVVEFANTGYLINAGATVAPEIKNCLFDRSGQNAVNNGSALSLATDKMDGNYFCTDVVGSVPAPVLPVASATATDDDLRPFAWSPIAQAGLPIGVLWDYNGNPFRAQPSIGALQA